MKRTKIRMGLALTLTSFTLMIAGMFGGSWKAVHAVRFQSASWSKDVQISGARRGNPWINVEDGRDVMTEFISKDGWPVKFEGNPLSTATADFDEDGMPDIVIGYEDGAALFMRGNVDALFPNTPEAKGRKAKGEFTDASFLSPARQFELVKRPDFLAAGDFDADGHFDIASASRNDDAAYFFKGNGKGSFEFAKKTELGGYVTAFLAEDFNRRDGTGDLIVGIQTGQTGRVLVFENPHGAMMANPEVFDFNTPVTSLTIGSLEGDARFDLAIAAGNELAVLRGRDRKLLLDESGSSAEAVSLSRRSFDFRIEAIAVGEFIASRIRLPEIAVLADSGDVHLLEKDEGLYEAWRESRTLPVAANPSTCDLPVMLTARVSARSIDTLVLGCDRRIHLLTSDFNAPRSDAEAVDFDGQKFELRTSLDSTGRVTAILPMRLNIDALSDLVVMKENSSAPTVVQTVPMASFGVDNSGVAPDEDISNNVCCTVPLVAGMCPVGACSLRAAIEQGNFISGSHQINFNIQSSGVPTIPGGTYSIGVTSVINGASQPGGLVEITGTNSLPANMFTGSQTDNCVFRGLVINGVGGNYYMNPQGINNIIEGNLIGTNSSGTAASGSPVNNTGGIAVGGANLIGGTTAAARNIISTGTGEGMGVNGLANGNTLRVQGNFIGTDVTGTVALGNFGNGVRHQGFNLTIGGTTAGAGNVISATTGDGNFGANGIRGNGGDGGGIGILIQGNRIGTNAAGTAALPNARFGFEGYTGTPFDAIGGSTPAARNVISGNGLEGIQVSTTGGGAVSSIIAGNFIGTNAAGSVAIPNGGFGISFGGSYAISVTSNVVSGNTSGGILYCGNNSGTNDVITLNLIGTDAGGNNPLGNGGAGLSTTCGGAVGNGNITNNIIAANGSHGVLAEGGFNLNFQANFIGTNAGGSPNLGNGGDGIRFANAFAQNNVSFNRITRNAGNGVNLATTNIFSLDNNIVNNRIWDNGGLGIDLGDDGVTPNDDCDAENGPNNFQNYPAISVATRRGNNIRITGLLNSAANANYTLHFYANQTADPSGFGEAQRELGQTAVAVPPGCQVNFTATVPDNLQSGRCLSATATDSNGNTSEFSNCIPIRTVANSFDNDGIADLAIFRPSNGQWWFRRSSDGVVNAATFGNAADRITPGDWTGDGVSDIAVWRPSTGQWFILRSEDSSFFAFPFGTTGDIPAPGDFDGDGKFDAAVFRPSNTSWFILRSSDGLVTISQFGSSQDKPVIADYDGDGRDDIAIFRPGVGEWWYRRSSDGGVLAAPFGSSSDRPVQGDYTGDGKADIAFWRPSTGSWFVLRSEDGSFFAFPWGLDGDIPAPSDYDGDGKYDPAVFRPSAATWFLNRSTDGVQILNFGLSGDTPVPSAYIPF